MHSRTPSRKTFFRIPIRGTFIAAVLLAAAVGFAAPPTESPEIMPLDQVKPGMKGVAYTIFAGDQIEKFDLVVLGILPDLIAPASRSSLCSCLAIRSSTRAWSQA